MTQLYDRIAAKKDTDLEQPDTKVGDTHNSKGT